MASMQRSFQAVSAATPEVKGVTYTFEKQEYETPDEFLCFLAFLEAETGYSPVRWVRESGHPEQWVEIAERNHWLARRNDYWLYIAMVQRNEWIKTLDSCRRDLTERQKQHTDRIEWAYQAEMRRRRFSGEDDEEADDKLGVAFDRAVKSAQEDIRLVIDVVRALTPQSATSINVVQQAVGSFNVGKDVAAIQRSWDILANPASPDQIVDGETRLIDKTGEP